MERKKKHSWGQTGQVSGILSQNRKIKRCKEDLRFMSVLEFLLSLSGPRFNSQCSKGLASNNETKKS
jgi:transposase